MKPLLSPSLACTLLGAAACLTLPGCGYHLGGYKPDELQNMHTFNVTMMENNSLEPRAAVLVTSAVADSLQRDGTYRLSSRGKSDFRIEGEISSVTFSSLRTNREDTYVSDEIAMNVSVKYRVVRNSDGKTLLENPVDVTAGFYNMGNVQTARTNAMSYAAMLIAQRITDTLTNG